MCTVSWWRRNLKLSLRFNRDEQRERETALPPEPSRRLLYPRDARSGGTWCCVDRSGTIHCLLNYYDAVSPALPLNPRSRGELPLLSAGQADRPFREWLRPRNYPPFHLLRIPLTGKIRHVIWDSRRLREGPEHSDLTHWTTSGWNPGEVVAARAELFEDMLRTQGLSEETLRSFHFSADPLQPGRWPRMSRAEALTVSHSEIRVTAESVEYAYTPLQDTSEGDTVLRRMTLSPLSP